MNNVDFPSAVKDWRLALGWWDQTRQGERVVATFEYIDALGKLLYSKERVEPGRDGGTKSFVFSTLTAMVGVWLGGAVILSCIAYRKC